MANDRLLRGGIGLVGCGADPLGETRVSVVDRIEDEFDAGRDAELFEDAEDVLLDGVFAELEFEGDFAVVESFGDEGDDLLLARREQGISGGIDDAEGRDFGNEIEQEVQLVGVEPDLSVSDAEQTFAEHAQAGIGKGKDAAGSGAKGMDDEFTIDGVDQKNLGDCGMGLMEGAERGEGGGEVDAGAEREQGDGGVAGGDGLEDGGGFHAAGADVEFGMAAQGSDEKLGLDAIGVRDQDTDRLGTGNWRLHGDEDFSS